MQSLMTLKCLIYVNTLKPNYASQWAYRNIKINEITASL